MLEKLAAIKERYDDITRQMSDPQVISDQSAYRKLAQTHAELSPIVSKYEEYVKTLDELEQAESLLEEDDAEMRELAREERRELLQRREKLEGELRRLLLPKDPNDEKNVVVEIRAGAGGEEAALFAGDLFRMYSRYAEVNGWKIDLVDSNPTELGGFKEVIFTVEGKGAYSRFKYESGVHRVQRVPTTESGGRIHTSTATVAVLPEAEEVEIEIDPSDLEIDVFRSSGPGGQSVNTTDSAVRITHKPTGIVVTCQDEKSQHKNRDKAMRVLRARLLDMAQQEQASEIAAARRSQVGTGDRSERIRTYNFPQGRVTDHRINLTLYRLETILQGEIDELIDALAEAEQAEKLEALDS